MTTPSGTSAIPDSAAIAFREFQINDTLVGVEISTAYGFCVADRIISLSLRNLIRIFPN